METRGDNGFDARTWLHRCFADADEQIAILLFDEDPVWQLPLRFGLYVVCAPETVVHSFRSPLKVLKEVNLQLVNTPFGPEALTRQDALELAIRYFFSMAQSLGLQMRLKPTDQNAARRERAAVPPSGTRGIEPGQVVSAAASAGPRLLRSSLS